MTFFCDASNTTRLIIPYLFLVCSKGDRTDENVSVMVQRMIPRSWRIIIVHQNQSSDDSELTQTPVQCTYHNLCISLQYMDRLFLVKLSRHTHGQSSPALFASIPVWNRSQRIARNCRFLRIIRCEKEQVHKSGAPRFDSSSVSSYT